MQHAQAVRFPGFGQLQYKGVLVPAEPGDEVSWNVTVLEDGFAYATGGFSANR